jgi:hypothetical protein
MVFKGKRETRNVMKLFTNVLPGSASLLGVKQPEAVDLNGIKKGNTVISSSIRFQVLLQNSPATAG